MNANQNCKNGENDMNHDENFGEQTLYICQVGIIENI